MIAYDPTRGRQTTALSFIVNRPTVEHGFKLERTEDRDRVEPLPARPPARDAGERLRSAAAEHDADPRPTDGSERRVSFEFGMRTPHGGITGAAEPEEYDVDEAEADRRPPPPDRGRPRGGARRDERHRGARPARPRADRAPAGQDADPRDRGAAADRPAPRRGRPRLRAAVAAHVVHRQPGHGQDDRRDEDGRGPAPARLHRGAARRRRARATTSSASTSATPRRRRRRCSAAPTAASSSSTRRTTSTGPRTSATTARRRSRSCSR